MEVDHALYAEAHRRSIVTNTSFKHSLRRETARRLRQIEEGKISASIQIEGPVVEVPLPQTPQVESPISEPGAGVGDLPKPSIEVPGGVNTKIATSASASPAEKVKKPRPAKSAKTTEVAAKPDAVPSDASTEPSGTIGGAQMTGDDDTDWSNADPEFIRKRGNIGRRVTWEAFGKPLNGDIIAVIPIGKLPREVGVEAGGKTAKPRDHLSYVVKNDEGSLVWPAFKGLAFAA